MTPLNKIKARKKSTSWLQRNITSRNRRINAGKLIKSHRKELESAFGGFKKNRTMALLKKTHNFDLENFIRARTKPGQKLRILDSGAGYFMLSTELKNVFGNSVFVTAVNLGRLKYDKIIAQLRETAKSMESPEVKAEHEAKAREFEKMREDLKKIDEIKVKPFENFSSSKKYGVIIDLFGPHTYSNHTTRVEHQYFSLLEEGGCIVTLSTTFDLKRYAKHSKVAEKTGFYLEEQELPHYPRVIVKKRITQHDIYSFGKK
ncbi:MAG: hypothetical protein WC821_05035 [archaeon]